MLFMKVFLQTKLLIVVNIITELTGSLSLTILSVLLWFLMLQC